MAVITITAVSRNKTLCNPVEIFLQNVVDYVPNYTASYLRKRSFKYL